MGFTGDSICIKDNLSFERIENLKEGDYLYNPNNKKSSKIIRIENYYSNQGYILKTQNFYEMNISEKTLLKGSLLGFSKNSNEKFLKSPTFKKPEELNKLSFLIAPIINTNSTKEFKELFLYSKVILKGNYNKDKLSFNNFKDKYSYYSNNLNESFDLEIGTNRNVRTIYLKNIEDIFWIDDISKKTSQRKLNENLFYISNNDFLYFLNEFLRENSSQFLDEKNFRVYVQSKIISTQMFYLIIDYLKDIPNIELVKKDIWDCKTTTISSNKKNKFAITCHNDLNKAIIKEDCIFQQISQIDRNNRNLKYYNIITEDNEPFIVYNSIVVPDIE